jgi:hypothetical protein
MGMVAVGMRVSPHHPHRSRRAELPHRALASSNDAEAEHWIRVTDSGGRKPLGWSRGRSWLGGEEDILYSSCQANFISA